MDEQDMLDLVFQYARTHPTFDTDFIESLQDWIDGGRELTEGQYSALENIIENFRL
jgi:hypothetical protein